MLHVAKSLRHIYGNNANEPFKRIRKQLSFNGAISSIASMIIVLLKRRINKNEGIRTSKTKDTQT
jgi:hypothetical protein